MTAADYENRKSIEDIHIPELEVYLKNFFEVAHVEIINYRVSIRSLIIQESPFLNHCEQQRRRHTAFPAATGDVYEHQQPAYRAHIGMLYT
jgi:hypothetical protein